VVGIRVSRTGTLEDLGVGIFIVALGPWLDGIDGVVHWAVAALPPPGVILPITTPVTVVIAAVTVIVVPIISVPLITPVVVATILLVRTRSLPNILLDLLVSLVSICPLFHHHEQVLGRFRPLTKQLSPKGVMIVEAPNKCGDGLIVVDVGDGYPCFQEAADVVTQRLIWIVFDFLQIIFVLELLTSGHVVINKSLHELSPGVDGAFPQAKVPLVSRLVNDHM
jgi:hypothetical protein